MPLAHERVAADQRRNPRKKMRQKKTAHIRIKGKAGYGLQKNQKNQTEIGKTRQIIMSDRNFAVQSERENIRRQNIPEFLKLRFPVGNVTSPACIFVADNAPVNAEQKIKEKDISRREMEKANPAEPVLLVGFVRAENRLRIADQIPRRGKNNDC